MESLLTCSGEAAKPTLKDKPGLQKSPSQAQLGVSQRPPSGIQADRTCGWQTARVFLFTGVAGISSLKHQDVHF